MFVKVKEVRASGATELDSLVGTILIFGVLSFSAPTLRSPFREQGTKCKIFFWLHAVTYRLC